MSDSGQSRARPPKPQEEWAAVEGAGARWLQPPHMVQLPSPPTRPDMLAFTDPGTGMYVASYRRPAPLGRGLQVPGALSAIIDRFRQLGPIVEQAVRLTSLDGGRVAGTMEISGADHTEAIIAVIEIDSEQVTVLEVVFPQRAMLADARRIADSLIIG